MLENKKDKKYTSIRDGRISEFAKDNKTYCPAAFTEIYVDSAQRYRLCCHAWPMKDMQVFKENQTPPFEYFLSEAMEEIRNKMMVGDNIPECSVCHLLEKNTGHSYRLRYLYSQGFVDDVRDVRLKLRIFGSFCNLGCYMCHPYNSSTRRKELKELYGEDMGSFFTRSKEVAVKHDQYNRIIDDILKNIHLVKDIHMTGGEPLQLPKYWEFVESIPVEHSKHITLIHDTNFTKIRYNNKSIYDLKDKFGKVYFGISCDHFGDKLKWIRYPISVDDFENNLKEFKAANIESYQSHLNCTVSILNIDDLEEIYEYYKNKYNMETTFHNVVTGPQVLSIKNLPEKLKEKYKKKYIKLPFVVDELTKQGSDKSYDEGIEYCDKLSQHRGFNFRSLWKDWIDYVESHRS